MTTLALLQRRMAAAVMQPLASGSRVARTTPDGMVMRKEAAEFIEFLSTQTLPSDTVVLTPGNPESHGWVLFSTQKKWIGPWKEREDFILSVWMKDRIWQLPFSLPPTEGDLILRKPPD